MNALWLGLSFLLRVPLPTTVDEPGGLGRSVRYWPLAGAVVGLAALVALTSGSVLVTPLVGAALAVAAIAWVTGGLHLDGLSDCFDALYANGDASRRLAVMHDSRAGALGAAFTALWLVVKVAAVHACVESGLAAAAIWLACVASRAALPWILVLAPAATPGKGLFGGLKAEVEPTDAVVATLFAAVLAPPALLVAPQAVGAIAVGLALAGAGLVAWLAFWRARIGGVNGDVVGGAVEVVELLVLLALGSPWLT